VHKPNRSIDRRNFLRLSALFTGGFVFSPLIHYLERKYTPLPQAPAQNWLGGSTIRQAPLPPNPLLKKLGFSESDRLLIAQVADLGLSEANLAAFTDLIDFGLISSGAAIVPSVWFPQVAHLARTQQGLDLGINLTLTSELDTLRWRPISTVDQLSGLLDTYGYFPKNGVDFSPATPETIAFEIKAQIQRAQGMGVPLTHIDSHQNIALNPAFTLSCIQAAQDYSLPLAFIRPDETQWRALPGINPEWISEGVNFSKQVEQKSAPLLDSILDLVASPAGDRLETTKQVIDRLQPGLHLIRIHAARDTPELRALTPDWPGHVADYQTWISPDLAAHIHKAGVQVIGWAPIQKI
jgi:predicted glycoside hydrolase/deacetylase ChbG (UPF0249 family)